MALENISELPVAIGLTGAEDVPVVQAGVTKRAAASLFDFSGGSSASTQSANTVLAGPTTGAPAAPAFRALVSADIPPALTLGVAGTTLGSLGLSGSTSGVVSILPQAAAGTFNFNLPITAGASGYVLTSGGGGSSPMTWTNPTSLGIDLDIGSTAITGGTTTRILYDNAGVLGEYTLSGSGTAVAMATSPTFTTSIIVGSATLTGPSTNVLGIGGSTSSFPAIKRSSAALAFRLADDSADAAVSGAASTWSGNLTFATNNTYDIGTAASTGKPRTGYFGTALVSPVLTVTQGTITSDSSQINGSVTWNNSGILGPAWKLNVTDTSSDAAALLMDLQVASSSKFKVDKTGLVTAVSLSLNSITAASLNLAGSSSGVVSILPQAAAGTYNFNLPTSAGSSGQPLLSAGGGASPMTFGTLGIGAGGTGQITATAAFDALAPTTTRGDLIFRNATTNTRLAASTAGYHLQTNGAGTDPTWNGFVQPTFPGATITWQAKAGQWVNAADYTSINAAVTAIGSTSATLIVSTAQTLAASLTIPSTLSLWIVGGGSIAKASTFTLTINGPFIAGPYQVFSGFSSGNVTFGTSATSFAYAEWWGAVGNDSTDDLNPLTYAIASLSAGYVLLMGKTYRISAGLTISVAGVGIQGLNPTKSCLNCTSASADILTVQGASFGSQINNNRVSGFLINRTTTPTGTAIGLRLQYTSNALIDDVVSAESISCFYSQGNGNAKWIGCRAVFSLGSSGSRYGWKISGANANASLQIDHCFTANLGGTGYTSYGSFQDGANIADTFFDAFESSACTIGQYVSGATASGANFDQHYDNCIHDLFTLVGFWFEDISVGTISVTAGWTNPANTGGVTYGLLQDGTSSLTVSGHTFFGGANYGFHRGFATDTSASNATVTANIFTGCLIGVADNAGSSLTISSNTFHNITGQTASVHISLSGTRCVVTGNVLSGYATTGISSSGANCVVQGNSVDPTNITTPYAVSTTTALVPTTQVFTSGTAATYSRPAGVRYIVVELVGGGGGGGGAGVGAGAATAATASTWSGGSLSAGGGALGTTSTNTGAAGGTAANGDINITGGQGGQSSSVINPGTPGFTGGPGGMTFWAGGGAGGVGIPQNGSAGVTNTGGGGGGGGLGATGTGTGGGGGGGAYVKKTIANPAATYTYTVGAAGAAGTAGTGGANGGAGAAGIIIVTEFYF